MVAGFKPQARKRRLIGIDTACDEDMTRRAVTKIARATAEMIGLNTPIEDADIIIDPRFAGPDYGLPDEQTIAAIRKTAQMEAMLNDPVNEGKHNAGMFTKGQADKTPTGARQKGV